MKKVNVNRLELEDPLFILDRVNKSIIFLSDAIVEYPNEGGLEEIATILLSLSDTANGALSQIKAVSKTLIQLQRAMRP